MVENVFYLNANESKGTLIIDELSSKVGEIAADSLAADLIAFELKDGPRFVKKTSNQNIYRHITILFVHTHNHRFPSQLGQSKQKRLIILFSFSLLVSVELI